MRTNWSIHVFALGVFLICSVQAYAQPLIDATQSIETTVINSDYVFIAKLVDFRPKKEGSDRYAHEGYYPVRYAAYQTLKEWGIDVQKPVYLEVVR